MNTSICGTSVLHVDLFIDSVNNKWHLALRSVIILVCKLRVDDATCFALVEGPVLVQPLVL